MKDGERSQIQDEWMTGKYPVICATVSFGMGVDKASVRFVVHWCMPQSVAGYYQESGRAGRDGLASNCRIYYSKRERDAVGFLLKQDVGKATSDHRKDAANAAFKSYERMVRYCEEAKCRHAVFAEFFGEDPPDCKGRCDVCRGGVKAAEKRVEDFYTAVVRRSFYTTPVTAMNATDDVDLYGGGRIGQRRENESYYTESSEDRDIRKEKKELDSLIKKQFSLRKQNSVESIDAGEEDDEDEEEKAKYAKVKSALSTKVKVNGLTIEIRERYLNLLIDLIKKNHQRAQLLESLEKSVSSKDCEDCAIDVEYAAFTANSGISLYRRALAKSMATIKKSTESLELCPFLKNHSPKEEGTLMSALKEESSKKSDLHSWLTGTLSGKSSSSEDASPDPKEGKKKSSHSGESEKEKRKSSSSLFKTAKEVEQLMTKDKTEKKGVKRNLETGSLEEDSKKSKNVSSSTPSTSASQTEDSKAKSPSSKISKSSAYDLYASSNHKRRIAHNLVPKKTSEPEQKEVVKEKNRTSEDSTDKNSARSNSASENSDDSNSLNKSTSSENNADSSGVEMKDESDTSLPGKPTEVHGSKLEDSKRDQVVIPALDLGNVSSKTTSKEKPQSKSSDSSVNKKKVADWVVKYLMPFYSQQKIASRELFKVLARNMSHHMLLNEEPPTDESVVKKRVKDFFKKHEVVTSEADITF
ncbi:hypothetical protein J437_LFUL001122 [Ladona fulva]|uniref:DNA 3'-5' helicase n=1 Tax=Ladona fulva TaxID=123851 RepID=A0A8K0NTG1_LADFU|nr:hypothetical protein J437_LFUL001122 [Ladona fulva]